MFDLLFPSHVSRYERITLTAYFLITIGFILFGIANEAPVFVVIPLIPVLYYLVTSNIMSGIYLLVMSFPFSITYAVPGAQIGIQLPTEPLIVAFLGFWIFHQILSHKKSTPFELWGKRFVIGYLLYFFALGLSVLVSDNMFSSAKLYVATLCYSSIFIYVLNHEIREIERVKSILYILFTVTLILVIYTLSRHIAAGLSHHYSNFAPNPFYGEHGSYGAYIAIVFAIAFSITISNKLTSGITFFAAIISALTFIAVIFSYARAAWVSVLVLFLFLLIVKFRRMFNFRVVAFLIVLAIGLSTMYVRIEINEELEKSITSITDVQRDVSNLERINRWVAAYNMFQANPVFGVGFGNYLFKYQDYRDYRFTTPISDMFAQAHSEYFQHLAETGLVGITAWLLFILILFIGGLKTYNKITNHFVQSVLIGALGAVLTYMIHGFFNGFLQFDKVAIPFWLSIGLCFLVINKWQYFEEEIAENDSLADLR